MSTTDANLVLKRTQALIDLGRFTEAASTARNVLAGDASNPDAACLLAQAELMAGDDLAAFESAQTAVKLAPDRAWAHRLLAISYARFENNEHEIQHAREAVRLEPHNSNGYVSLARALAREKSALAQARTAGHEAVRLAPHSVEAHMAVAHVADRSGDRPTAEAALRQALAIDPEHSAAQNNLARLRLSASHRAFNPSALAEVAGGFATAVRTNPAGQTSRLNLDLVIRVFLQRTAYLIFIDAWLCARIGAHTASAGIRLLPVAVLAIPLGYALRFLQRVSPTMRSHIAREVRFDRSISLPAFAMTIAAILILGGAIAPETARTVLAAGAALTAIAARLMLYRQVRRISATARHQPGSSMVSRTSLWILAAALALTAGLLAIAYTKPAGGRPAELVAAAIAGALAVTAGALARQQRS